MIINNIKTKIIEYFFINPTKKLRIRQIERETNSPLPSVIRYVKELIEEGLLKKEEISNITIYSANRMNPKYLLYKKLNNIESIYTSGILEYIESECSPDCIILFGSASKGEDIESSDIDLYVQSSQKALDFRKFSILGRIISVFFEQNFNSLSIELKNNIINGIILKGYLIAYESDKNNTKHRTSKKHNKDDFANRRKNKK
ncbi:MAG: nucleotidyltransferase domain-containing protein [Candidatus Woesearchaeota archaeon]